MKFNILQESISSPLQCYSILYVLNICLHLMVSIFLSSYFSFILRVHKGSIFSHLPKDLEGSLIPGSLPLRTCSPKPAVSPLCAQLLPVIVTEDNTGLSPLSNGEDQNEFYHVESWFGVGSLGLEVTAHWLNTEMPHWTATNMHTQRSPRWHFHVNLFQIKILSKRKS